MNKIRCFIGIPIPVNSLLTEFYNKLHDCSTGMKLVSSDSLHLTVKFLGDVSEQLLPQIINTLDACVSHYQPFEICVQGTGAFPHQKYMKVLWIGIQPTELVSSLADDIDTQLHLQGFEKEKRPFSAHLTVARVKYLSNKLKVLALLESYQHTLFSKVLVTHVNLYTSTLTPQGPIYSCLHSSEL